MSSIVKDFKRLTSIDKIILLIISILLFAFVMAELLPLIYVFVASFMDPDQLLTRGITFNITEWNLDAYLRVLRDNSIVNGFIMSMFYSFGFSVISIVVTVCMAYPLSIDDFVGKKLINVLLLITMFFGGGLIPTFLLIQNLGLYNTVWAILLPGAIGAWNIILARTFFKGLPVELKEASLLDGASNFQYFVMVAVALSKPIIAVLFMYSFVGQWNSFFDAMIYLENEKLQPLQLVLRRILIQNNVPEGMISDQKAMAELSRISSMIKYSTIVISSVPLLIMYPFFQKYFEKGVMVGSLKG